MNRSRRSSIEAFRPPLAAVAAALLAVACTTVTPTPSPAPTLMPSPSLGPTLHIDGMATVVADELKRVFDPKHPDRHPDFALPLEPLATGDVVLLVDGPLRIQGVDYWQVAMDPYNVLLGWAPLIDESGVTTLIPFVPTCPRVEELTALVLNSLGGLRALVCFGDHELRLHGEVECNRAIADGGIGGAGYFDSNRHCILDESLSVFGDAVTAILDQDPSATTVSGEYSLRGHFDDDAARGCGWIPIGVSLSAPTTPEPSAVLFCRTNFVVTGLEP